MNMHTNIRADKRIHPRSTLLALATALVFAGVAAGCRDQAAVEDGYNGRVAPGAEGVADDAAARTPADPALMPDNGTGMDAAQGDSMQGDATAGDQGWRVGEDQATFLRGALASGEAEVALSRHVQGSATSQEVRDLARRIADDHEALNGRLRDAGAASGAADATGASGSAANNAAAGGSAMDGAAPNASAQGGSTSSGAAPRGTAATSDPATTQSGMNGAAAADPMVAQIRGMRGAEMERAYLTHMRDGHRKSIARYEAAAANDELGAEVRSLAEQALPTLRAHLDAVQQAMDRPTR